ncbi:kinesin light chain-like [Xenia sp. Carnegie-2017]|uniref:kinesin light chain-like n=1 Tax=Xenia sp. Carnegie-2017 TaxID=2897299 RepID=UPI001F038DA3|nr:kinesin light chain-like [Xenia sp. Carnegie-2017]
MEKEKAMDDMFLVDVVATAMVVVFTSVEKVKNEQKTTLTTQQHNLLKLQDLPTKAGKNMNQQSFRTKQANICKRNAEKYLNEVLTKDIINEEKFACVLTKEAWCKQQRGKIEEAFNLYKKAATYTADDLNPEKAEILNNIGLCFLSLGMKEKAFEFKGDYEEAIKNLEDAKVRYDQLGDEISISLALRNLEACLSLKDPPKYDLALVYAQQALEKIKNSVLHYYNPGIARSLSVLGLCLLKAGKFKEAKQNQLEALDIIENLFSEDHPCLIDIYQLLYELYMIDGEQKEAKEYEKKKMKIVSEIEKMAKNIEKNIEIRWKPLPDNPSSKKNGKSEN